MPEYKAYDPSNDATKQEWCIAHKIAKKWPHQRLHWTHPQIWFHQILQIQDLLEEHPLQLHVQMPHAPSENEKQDISFNKYRETLE